MGAMNRRFCAGILALAAAGTAVRSQDALIFSTRHSAKANSRSSRKSNTGSFDKLRMPNTGSFDYAQEEAGTMQ